MVLQQFKNAMLDMQQADITFKTVFAMYYEYKSHMYQLNQLFS